MAKKKEAAKTAKTKSVKNNAVRSKTSRMSKLDKKVARCEAKAPKKALPSTVTVVRSFGEVVYDGFLVKIDTKARMVHFRRKKTSASAKMQLDAFRFEDVVEVFGKEGKGSAQITVSRRDVPVRTIQKATVDYTADAIVVTDEHGDVSHFFRCQGYDVIVNGDTED